MNLVKESCCRANFQKFWYFFIFAFGVSIIALQVTRSKSNVGLECERVSESDQIQRLIKEDRDFCHNEFQKDIRDFQLMNVKEGGPKWCPFEHVNVGHELTRNESGIHTCFPSAPPDMELQIPCPNNSTAYYWDNPNKHLKRKCLSNGTWEEHTGHCGCHYDILKWDRVAYYFSGFQKFKVLLVIFSATSLVVATLILTRLNSLHCTRNTIHLHLFVACLLYNTTDLVVFFFAVTMASKERFKYENGEVDKYEDAQNNNLHKYLCRGKDVMTIYSLLAIYTWVLIEGVYLHSLVLTAFHNGGGITKMKYFAPFGWLLPLVITITWVVVNQFFRDKNAVCWDSNLIGPGDRWIGWIYDIPKKLLLLMATVLFFSVLRILWSKLSSSQRLTTLTTNAQERNDVSRNAPKYAQIVRASIILLVVYGIWDLKELFMHQDEFRPETTGWWIVMLIDILIDSMRGFFIASVYCFSNTEVRQEITRLYRRRCINNELRRTHRYHRGESRSSEARRTSSISRNSISTALHTNPRQSTRMNIAPKNMCCMDSSNQRSSSQDTQVTLNPTTGVISRHSSGDSVIQNENSSIPKTK